MISDADRAKYPLPAKPAAKLSLIDRADEVVDIRDILKPMGVWTPEGLFYSYKINCPWNYEHADAGMDKNCRLFGKTNIYCWAMHGFITPTLLYARWKSVPRTVAAETLLEERGLLKKPWRETWNALLDQREETTHKLGSKQDVVSALHTILDASPEYTSVEFSESVRLKWQQVLRALDLLWEMPDLEFTKLNQFFDKSLTALQKAAKES